MKSAAAARSLALDAVTAPRRAAASALAVAALAFVIMPALPRTAFADEGGVSFWLPGLFGSLAAVPQQPGWSATSIYYHTSVWADGAVSLAREFEIGRIPLQASGRASAHLDGSGDLGLLIPSYVFATPVLGGRASASLMGIYGNVDDSLLGTVSGHIGPFPFGPRFDSIQSSATGLGDLYPMLALRWNSGADNYMTYVTGDVPVGDYSSTSLANIGIGHGAVDAGGGYTYFDPQSGHELSAMLGFTYNLINQGTQYQNGVDMHLDWGASQFLSKQLLIGAAGYLYDQISCDGGAGDRVGCFESRVVGVGPQIGYLFPVGTMQGYLNLKAYGEFAAADRPAGWNAWLTFEISPPAPAAAAASVVAK